MFPGITGSWATQKFNDFIGYLPGVHTTAPTPQVTGLGTWLKELPSYVENFDKVDALFKKIEKSQDNLASICKISEYAGSLRIVFGVCQVAFGVFFAIASYLKSLPMHAKIVQKAQLQNKTMRFADYALQGSMNVAAGYIQIQFGLLATVGRIAYNLKLKQYTFDYTANPAANSIQKKTRDFFLTQLLGGKVAVSKKQSWSHLRFNWRDLLGGKKVTQTQEFSLNNLQQHISKKNFYKFCEDIEIGLNPFDYVIGLNFMAAIVRSVIGSTQIALGALSAAFCYLSSLAAVNKNDVAYYQQNTVESLEIGAHGLLNLFRSMAPAAPFFSGIAATGVYDFTNRRVSYLSEISAKNLRGSFHESVGHKIFDNYKFSLTK